MLINQAREQAFKLASSKYIPSNTDYEKFSSIYIASTSNVKDTMSLYKDYEKVLSVGSTGAHGFEAALNNAKIIDLFDVNELQRLYFEYMQTAIKYLDYETFIKHFTLKEQSSILKRRMLKDLLSEELYCKIVYYLPNDVEKVFSPLYEYFDSIDLILSKLYRFEYVISLDYLKRYVSFYNEEQYYQLQKILRNGNCQINYKIVSLIDLPKVFDNKYDLIVLDNILQYYKKIARLNSSDLVNQFISKDLSTLLTANGIIQVNYGYEVAADAFKMKLNIPFNSDNLSLNSKIMLQNEIKESINISLVENWDDYSYSFIPGVEQIEGRDSENLVLTYKK